jgi:cytoskeletal protein CcmA (bactofilin family)
MLRKQKDGFEQSNNEYQVEPKQSSYTGDNSDKEKTVIGEHISIDGTVKAKEDLIIQGSLKGAMELEKHHVTVGNKGKVEADIQAESATISGKVNGNVTVSGKVEITQEADFSGQIKAKRLVIEDGSYINASIEMQREEDKKPKPEIKQPTSTIVIDKEPIKSVLGNQVPAGK